tara:strand:- start:85 stop:1050 length:966 start_codon:yes stop_codon:yes gene_type:complete
MANTLELACANLDNLLCLEIQGAALPYGVKTGLYDAAREAEGRPLTLAAAELLDRPPSSIGIVTGAAVPDHMPAGENDGPLGSVILAEALVQLGHRVTIYTDPPAAPPIESLVKFRSFDAACVHLGLHDIEQQDSIVHDLDMAIGVERHGGNPKGNLYGVTGLPRHAFRSNVDHLFTSMTRMGKATLGVGDGGNEVGFGKVYDVLCERMPEFNLKETTECGEGIFTIIPADALVVGTSSNIGCYGIVAALALKFENAELCHTADSERALVAEGVKLGLTDGGSGQIIEAIDGVPVADNAAVVYLMEAVVRRALAGPGDRGF